MLLNLAFLGFGNVNRAFAELLIKKKDFLKNLGFDVRVTAVLTSKGGIVQRSMDPEELLEARHPSLLDGFVPDTSVDDLIGVDVVLFAIPPSYSTGEPNISLMKSLMERGTAVITADKTPLAHAFTEVMDLARSLGTFIGIRATVMAGTPVIDLVRGLRGREVTRISAVLNGTTNYLLTLIERGSGFEEAVDRLVGMGLAEPDPSIDVEGLDSAAKLTILLNLLGKEVTISEVERTPLTEINEEEIRKARMMGRRYKYLAVADLEKEVFQVKPELLKENDPLAAVEENYNAIKLHVEDDVIVLTGPAGPPPITARAMFTDLLELAG